MEIGELKKKYQGKLTFWGGGCDTQHILPEAKPEEIRRHVKAQIDIMKSSNGGFVFQQVHNVMANVPTKNLLAMFEAVDMYR